MMVDYPKEFPVAQIANYGLDINYGVSTVAFERGNVRQRRSTKTEKYIFNLSFAMKIMDLAAWQSWANQYGYDFHWMPLESDYSGLTDSVLVNHFIRFISDLSIEPIDFDYVRVSVQAEMDVNTLPQGVVVNTGNWIIAGTPAAPSNANTIIGGTPAAPSSDFIIAGTPGFPAA